MRIRIKSIMAGLWIGAMLASCIWAGDKKLAQTGFQFLSVVSDARAAGMAEAMTSLEMRSSSLFFNPAGLASMDVLADVSASRNEWIADISHNTFSLALRPVRGEYGVLGFTFQNVDYGDFLGTRVDKKTDRGFVDTETFGLTSMALGVGYAKRLTDRFSVGAHVRWVQQDLGESIVPEISTKLDTTQRKASNKLSAIAIDFGTQFRTGIKSLVFGMSVRNFSKEIKYAEEGFQLPLVFNLGISMDVMDLFGEMPLKQSLVMSVDACHHRDHPEQVKIGLDYRLMNLLSIRGGYVSSNDEDGFSFGMGVSRYGLSLDYAYTPFGVFDKVQRMTARFSF